MAQLLLKNEHREWNGNGSRQSFPAFHKANSKRAKASWFWSNLWTCPGWGGRKKKLDGLRLMPFVEILNAWRRPALRRLLSRRKKLSWRSLSSLNLWRRPLTSRVARRWILSGWVTLAIRFVEFASVSNYGCARTIAQSSEVNAFMKMSNTGLRTIKSNHLTIFAAFLLCTEKVNGLSGEPREPWCSWTLENWIAGVCRRDEGEMGGRHSTAFLK